MTACVIEGIVAAVAFTVGDRVHLAGLGTGVVLEARGGDRYAIDIKSRVVIAAGRDLELAAHAPKPRRERHTPAEADTTEPSPSPAAPSLDLHGKTVEQALAEVERFVNDALVSGCGHVRLVHGKSGGRVKAGVHRLLGRFAAVAHYRLDPHNAGVTIVTFV